MSLYKGMDAQTLEAEYNLRARRGSDFDALFARWLSRSADQRAAAGAQVDLAYGAGERDKLDYFSGGARHGALLIYIHGGYWQRGDKSIYSFVTEGFVKHGVSVAVVNYSLTPSVRIGAIAPQIRRAIVWIWQRAAHLGFSRERMSVMGHSAGGHLTAMMMATDWPALDATLPAELIHAGVPISALFELEPLVHTSINEGPRMDIEEAVAESPMFMAPATNAPQLVVVGGTESGEFHRQADDYMARYATPGRPMERYDVPDADHFDELERLAEDDSVFFHKSMRLIAD